MGSQRSARPMASCCTQQSPNQLRFQRPPLMRTFLISLRSNLRHLMHEAFLPSPSSHRRASGLQQHRPAAISSRLRASIRVRRSLRCQGLPQLLRTPRQRLQGPQDKHRPPHQLLPQSRPRLQLQLLPQSRPRLQRQLLSQVWQRAPLRCSRRHRLRLQLMR